MPLDPIFSERLAVHRRYLVGQAMSRLKELLHWPWFARGRRVSVASVAQTEVVRSASARTAPAAVSGRPASPRSRRTRAQHRRAAREWDRKELDTVGTPGPDVRTADHHIPVPGYPAVRIRVYYPWERTAERDERDSLLPACLAFFGGAFRIGGIDYPTTDASYRRRAAEAGVAMVAVDYALAPEHRYPTQVEQGYAALTWLRQSARALGIDGERLALAGTSAGANLAAAVALVNRDRGGAPVRLQLLEVPVVDLTGKHIDLSATRALGIPTPIAIRELRSVARTYLRSRAHAKEAYASPLRAQTHEGLPPTYILTAEYDPLKGDGVAYAAALRAAGMEASAVQYLGVTHDAWIFTRVLPAARRWHADVVTILRSLHERT